jgi:hypothetical protein
MFTVGSGPSSFHSAGEEDGTGEEGSHKTSTGGFFTNSSFYFNFFYFFLDEGILDYFIGFV